MTEAIGIALTTLPSRDEADRLAADAVAAGLAACAQVDGPIRSHYTWEGKVESEDEFRWPPTRRPDLKRVWPFVTRAAHGGLSTVRLLLSTRQSGPDSVHHGDYGTLRPLFLWMAPLDGAPGKFLS